MKLSEDKIVYLDLSQIKPYENNPRINDGAVDAVAESIKKFGFHVPIVLDRSDNVLKLLERVRDESHRFAITFHRNLRGKALKSSLLEIEGVGKQKAQALLKHFKSVEVISKASEKDLMKADGIGENLAKIIYDFYHNDNL